MLRQWLAAILGTFIGFSVLYHFAPVVVADYLDSTTVQPVETHVVDAVDCKVYVYLVSHCSLQLRERNKPDAQPLHMSHLYMGRVGDQPMVPVAIGAESQRLGVSAAFEHLRGRALAMLLVAILAFTSLMGCAHMADMKD
jgi:hypothetical protein